MDTATQELYFQKLEELVQDNDKIVTIPHLANILNISIQDSRNLISKYVSDQRILKPNELFVTYVLTGNLTDKGRCVIIVKEDDLVDKRALFDKVESELLFSVQKCKQIDFNVIALVDNVTGSSESPLIGSIVGQNCIRRKLKIKKLPTPPPTTIKGKSSFFMAKTDSSNNSDKSEPSSKAESKPKSNGIANMFSKAATSQVSKEKVVKNLSSKPKQGLLGFLSKGSNTSSFKSETGITKEDSISSVISENQPSPIEELMDVDFHEVDDSDMLDTNKTKENEVDKETNKSENNHVKKETNKSEENDIKKETNKSEENVTNKKVPKKSETKSKKSKNKRQRENSEEKFTKKRKRIIERNDSESDDMFENDDEDVIEKSDEEPERIPSPVEKKPLAPKNKIRKAVDKTYMDEDGFIVTQTEYVYEAAPEDEVVSVKVEKEVTKPKLEKKTSASSENDATPQKGSKSKKGKKNNMQNQPTLMNFFKKN